MDGEGFVINPRGCSFRLTKDLIKMIFEADGDVKYSVPDDKITTELLKDGSFLKEAIEICNRNRTKLNILKLLQILRDSWVWVPCNAIMSEADGKILEKAIEEAEAGEGIDSLVGKNFTVHDNIRLVPDILQNGESFFFPVFTSASEMGEYGERFSKIEKHFLEAIILAKNNERDVDGIVINAFSEPFIINKELFEMIEELQSSLDK